MAALKGTRSLCFDTSNRDELSTVFFVAYHGLRIEGRADVVGELSVILIDLS
jgi:phage replication-related protein YjqB (UPF0714/DUF867 family)